MNGNFDVASTNYIGSICKLDRGPKLGFAGIKVYIIAVTDVISPSQIKNPPLVQYNNNINHNHNKLVIIATMSTEPSSFTVSVFKNISCNGLGLVFLLRFYSSTNLFLISVNLLMLYTFTQMRPKKV